MDPRDRLVGWGGVRFFDEIIVIQLARVVVVVVVEDIEMIIESVE